MKVTQLLHTAEEAIQRRDKTHCGSFDICIIEGEIKCIRSLNLRPEFLFICTLTISEVATGLTNTKWDRIWRGLFNALREGKIT